MKLLTLIFSIICFNAVNAQQPVAPLEFDTIYTKPEFYASYPGGDSAWQVYVKKNIKYPKKAWWDEIETEITVKIVIDKTGEIKEAKHLTTAGYGFEKEAIRVVMASGKWKPATHRGKPVSCEGTLVIPFRLKN